MEEILKDNKQEKRETMDYTVEEKEAFMREALKEAEIALDKLSVKEYEDPFRDSGK